MTSESVIVFALLLLHRSFFTHPSLQDAFLDNFMVEWIPKSLSDIRPPPAAHPRVWLFDFETAIAFPPTTSIEECMCVGGPWNTLTGYRRRVPPPLLEGTPYNVTHLDLFQFNLRLPDIQVCV